jgi:competence protein ComEC
MRKQIIKLNIYHLVVFLCLAVFIFSTNSAAEKDGLLKVYFFDVGQGDSIFIESPNGTQVLIDGGPDGKVVQKLSKVMPFYDREIDLVILSHPDADHVTGLIEVLERYDIENILDTRGEHDNALFKAWGRAVGEENARFIEAIAGKSIHLGGGVELIVVYPLVSLEEMASINKNNNSIVLMLKYKENEILLTGDMEILAERSVLANSIDVDADVLKIAHHGSKTSTTESFLSSVSPQVAIIQVGEKNRYRHPHKSVLSRLDDYGIRYYRNDTDGDIKLISDGIRYQIFTY